MPGIAGIISNQYTPGKEIALGEMVESMMHEPFYTSGTFVHKEAGLFLGYVCQSSSGSSNPPFWNENRDVGLIFVGENFEDQEQIQVLKAKGHLISPGDSSYLVHLYEEIGPAFIEKLNGTFSGVLVDLRKSETILFNDRFGLNRIYVHGHKDGLFFSSEAKGLLRVLPALRNLNAEAVAEFCSCGCALQNKSLFSDVSLLPNGSKWTFGKGASIRKERYFRKETWENQLRLSGPEFNEKLRATFPRVLARYVRGENPVAMSLTGGLDGRLIMAWAGCPPGALPCYTFGGEYRDCTDVTVAQKVAQTCRQLHHTLCVDRRFLTEFPGLAEKAVLVSDGSMDVTGAVGLYINRLARDIAPVRLTGNYGSEILRGCVAFKPGLLDETLYRPELLQAAKMAAATYAQESQGRRLSFIALKQMPWHHHSCFAVEQSQVTVRSPFLDNELVALAYQAPQEIPMTAEQTFQLIAEGNPALSQIATDRGLRHRPVPLFTRAKHMYEELTSKAEYAFDSGMPQWLARLDHLVSPLHLERVFLGRHKFCHFRVWYRDQLAEYVKGILLDSRTLSRPYIRAAALERMVHCHTKGQGNYTNEITQILSLELIQRQLIERN